MNRRNFIKSSGAAAGLAVLAPAVSFPTEQRPSILFPFHAEIKPISSQERLGRQETAKRLMKENKLDAILLEGETSLQYFTGVSWGHSERLFVLILPQAGEAFYIAPKFEEGRAKEQVGDAKVYTWQENENPYELIGSVLKKQGLAAAKLGLEESTRYFIVENLQKNLTAISLQSATPVTAGCRSIKSAHEIELMQIANDITAQVYTEAVKQLQEGMTEKEFGKIISRLFSQAGVQGGALVLFGEASAYPHGLVKENRLKQGDIVLIDGGCSVEGYESDITRTTVFGKPTEKMKEVWAIVREAQDAALKAAKPGIPAEQVDAAARQLITAKGYGPGYTYFTHRLGHGIGMDGHEWYYLVGGNKRLLQSGNMFSNEPGIYIPGAFGIRIEDELLITETGSKLLLPQAPSLEKMF
ncbi:MAG TPA: Xaa-Pro peptidase family protein [Bacteroidia bacterium]|jgi:Xaa-Pro dipeptidase|nr:Xaa-Pro peptidase family protein [Bacteroidia bacterium]